MQAIRVSSAVRRDISAFTAGTFSPVRRAIRSPIVGEGVIYNRQDRVGKLDLLRTGRISEYLPAIPAGIVLDATGVVMIRFDPLVFLERMRD